MLLFNKSNKKNDDNEKLIYFANSINNLLSLESFISRKQYLPLVDATSHVVDKMMVMEDSGILFEWCKKNKLKYVDLKKRLDIYNNLIDIVAKHNDQFVKNNLLKENNYLDTMLAKDDPKIKLDNEQRQVVLRDEDYTLVVAGAGAGKTTTIEAKVKYLVDKKNIAPNRILVVSFTKKATNELKERFNRLELPINIATFHSIGNTIIKKENETHHAIVDYGYMFDTIRDYLITKLDDEYFIKKICLFFASYLTVPFSEEDAALIYKSLSQNNNVTLKSDLMYALDDYKNSLLRKKETFNCEKVRSIDECRIANFLYINGIDYIYEPIYQYGFKDTTKPYLPDFLIKQGNTEVYLEHFGISESGTNNRFSVAELNEYKKHINDKISIHKEHGTKLIYTFSKYNDNRDLITHLKEILENAGFVLNAKSDLEIYKDIANKAENKYFNKFIMLVCNFINKFKVSNFDESKFNEWKIALKDERSKLFVEIAAQCYRVYEIALKEKKAIDFEDMINQAVNILDDKIKTGDKLPYDYIFIDEYQDISLQRFDLAEKLSKASDAKIVAVGDDWQSIFRFSGAKVSLFTKFAENMGYADILKITQTYRNSQELIDVAGKFVMQNKEQISKSLKSAKREKNPVILMSYDDSYEKDKDNKGPFYRMGLAIEEALESISLKYGENSKVLLIGRYNFDGKNLSRLENMFSVYDSGKIVSKKFPQLQIDFMTAHSSKGLGYDNVILINGKDDVLGFPSKIQDDPVMKLVIKDDENIEYAEERRLFYVALTRTKNRVYIITPRFTPSKFILEIKDSFTNILLRGDELESKTNDYRIACPYCGYPLQKRANKNFKLDRITSLWMCSNDPEVCGFITNDLTGGRLAISKCMNCEDGYMVVKKINDEKGVDTGKRMLGCTNYKKDGTGCHATLMPSIFTQDKEKLAIQFYDSSISVNNMLYMSLPIKDCLYNLYYAFKSVELTNFQFGYKTLTEYLIGEKSNSITSFKLDKTKTFGCFSKNKKTEIVKLINSSRDIGIIAEQKDEKYLRIIWNNNIKIDEKIIKELFGNLVN